MQPDEKNNQSEGFGLPGGYFQSAAERLKNSLECLEELRGLETLSALRGQMPFSIPQGYFGQKTDQEVTARLPKGEAGFTAPPGFFETQEEQLRVYLPLSLRAKPGFKESVFKTPEGYTDGSREKLERKLSGGGKILPLKRLRSFSFAAAAVLLIVTGIWVFRLYFDTNEPDCLTIACLEKRDVIGSGVLENFTEDELMLIVDEDELARALGMGGPSDDPLYNADSLSDEVDE